MTVLGHGVAEALFAVAAATVDGEVQGERSLTDWLRRPLDDRQKTYAAADVARTRARRRFPSSGSKKNISPAPAPRLPAASARSPRHEAQQGVHDALLGHHLRSEDPARAHQRFPPRCSADMRTVRQGRLAE